MTNFYLISAFLLFYMVLIFKMLNTKIWSSTNLLVNSKHFSLVKNWTLYLFVINVFSSLMLMIAIYKEANNIEVLSGKSMASFLLILWLFVFFKILTSPEILFGLPILNRTLLKFNDDGIENQLASESYQKTQTTSKLATNWILETESE